MLAAAVALAACGGGSKPTSATATTAAATAAAAKHKAKPPPSKPVTFTVEASGDLLIHGPVWERALVLGHGRHYDFVPMFRAVERFIRGADLPLCHVETPMTPAPPTGYPVFNTPPDLATSIKRIGFKVCSTAATHTLDQGRTGVIDTIRALDHAGVLHTGSFLSAAAQRRPLIFRVKGVKVSFLSYTDITNGERSPDPWSVNRANAPQILADARRARRAGAQVVIVNIHWGDEDVATPSAEQMHLADVLTRSPDITTVVGQHVHIVQPIRRMNGKVVVFGEGNLISNQTSACCPAAAQDGLIALLTISVAGRRSWVSFVRYVPIWVRHPDFSILPAGLSARSDRADAAQLRASYERTVAEVGRGPHLHPVPWKLP